MTLYVIYLNVFNEIQWSDPEPEKGFDFGDDLDLEECCSCPYIFILYMF